jgi:hypothetical protein
LLFELSGVRGPQVLRGLSDDILQRIRSQIAREGHLQVHRFLEEILEDVPRVITLGVPDKLMRRWNSFIRTGQFPEDDELQVPIRQPEGPVIQAVAIHLPEDANLDAFNAFIQEMVGIAPRSATLCLSHDTMVEITQHIDLHNDNLELLIAEILGTVHTRTISRSIPDPVLMQLREYLMHGVLPPPANRAAPSPNGGSGGAAARNSGGPPSPEDQRGINRINETLNRLTEMYGVNFEHVETTQARDRVARILTVLFPYLMGHPAILQGWSHVILDNLATYPAEGGFNAVAIPRIGPPRDQVLRAFTDFALYILRHLPGGLHELGNGRYSFGSVDRPFRIHATADGVLGLLYEPL